MIRVAATGETCVMIAVEAILPALRNAVELIDTGRVALARDELVLFERLLNQALANPLAAGREFAVVARCAAPVKAG